jgi:chromosome partitioning protein
MTKHVCVINWKGGCGKTTIATHLAVALASNGLETGLADYDRQETAKLWEKLRPKNAVGVSLINWRKDFGPSPDSLQRLIVDCPPSLRIKRVRAIIAESNIAVVPILPSIFDEMATLAFLKHLEAIKSVRKHKKRVLLVANRYRTDRSASRRLEEFLVSEGLASDGTDSRARDLFRPCARRPHRFRPPQQGCSRAAAGVAAAGA